MPRKAGTKRATKKAPAKAVLRPHPKHTFVVHRFPLRRQTGTTTRKVGAGASIMELEARNGVEPWLTMKVPVRLNHGAACVLGEEKLELTVVRANEVFEGPGEYVGSWRCDGHDVFCFARRVEG